MPERDTDVAPQKALQKIQRDDMLKTARTGRAIKPAFSTKQNTSTKQPLILDGRTNTGWQQMNKGHCTIYS